MPGGYLYGWDDVNDEWVKVTCNADGELAIDPSLILEDTPTDDELEKAPTSNWAYDHENDADAHHVKYTDVESRAAIGDIFGSDGKADADIDLDGKYLLNPSRVRMTWPTCLGRQFFINFDCASYGLKMYSYDLTSGARDTTIRVYDGAAYKYLIHEGTFQTNLALFLENAPTEDEDEKAPSSEWAYDHKADADAHHAKYTDAEAQAACNLDGDLYWTLSGIGFLTEHPDIDDVTRRSSGYIEFSADDIDVGASVNLPHGATVTEVIIYGNAGATSQTWVLRRFTLSDQSSDVMASAVVGTADATINYAVIDNSIYNYYLYIAGLDSGDRIYGARIKYTL